MGIGAAGKCHLTEPEFDALINYYRLDNEPSSACWRKFDDEIESSEHHK